MLSIRETKAEDHTYFPTGRRQETTIGCTPSGADFENPQQATPGYGKWMIASPFGCLGRIFAGSDTGI